jgi:hypothetical protein
MRFAALLLFQWRVVVEGRSGVRRLCEQRMINFRSRDATSALSEARRRGDVAQFRYRNSDGNPVRFEFIGILDLLDLGVECGPDEVWYDIVQLNRPMERRSQLVPPARLLTALSCGARRPNKPLQPTAAHAVRGLLRYRVGRRS